MVQGYIGFIAGLYGDYGGFMFFVRSLGMLRSVFMWCPIGALLYKPKLSTLRPKA